VPRECGSGSVIRSGPVRRKNSGDFITRRGGVQDIITIQYPHGLAGRMVIPLLADDASNFLLRFGRSGFKQWWHEIAVAEIIDNHLLGPRRQGGDGLVLIGMGRRLAAQSRNNFVPGTLARLEYFRINRKEP